MELCTESVPAMTRGFVHGVAVKGRKQLALLKAGNTCAEHIRRVYGAGAKPVVIDMYAGNQSLRPAMEKAPLTCI
jgi:hypothetical protein